MVHFQNGSQLAREFFRIFYLMRIYAHVKEVCVNGKGLSVAVDDGAALYGGRFDGYSLRLGNGQARVSDEQRHDH